MTESQTTAKRVWSAYHIDRSQVTADGTVVPTGEKFWSIHEHWFDDQGRRCTRIIAEVHEQAADPEAAAENAKRIVEAVNAR